MLVISGCILLLCVSLGLASSHDECEFVVVDSTTGSTLFKLNEIDALRQSDVGNNALVCNCTNSSRSVVIILPDGNMATSSASLTAVSSDGSFSIVSTGANLDEGVYSCSVDGEQVLHLFLLIPRELRGSSLSTCSEGSGGVTLSAQSTGSMIPVSELTCFIDGVSVDTDTTVMITDRNRPTGSSVSALFPRPTEFGSFIYICNSTHEFGSFTMSCNLTISSVIATTSPPRTTPPPMTTTEVPVIAPAIPSVENSPQVSAGNTVISPLSQVSIDSIDSGSPLWCQGSDSTDAVSWTLPDGTVLTHTSPDTSIVSIVPTSTINSLGIIPASSGSFPPGIYICSVGRNQFNFIEVGSADSFQAPAVVGDHDCRVEGNPGVLIMSTTTLGGIPNNVSCVPTRLSNKTSILPVHSNLTSPFEFDFSAMFSPAVPGLSYTCTISNDQGFGEPITCTVLDNPIDLTAIHSTNDTSLLTFAWTIPDDVSSISGYTLQILSTEGDVLRSVTISSPLTNKTTVDIVSNERLSARIRSFGSQPNTFSTFTSTTIDPRQCEPGKGYKINMCLERPLADGESNEDDCTECSTDTFGQMAFDSLLESDHGCIDSTECITPMIFHDKCKCNRKKPKRKGKKGGKKSKGDNDDNNDNEEMREVCLEGKLVCGSCEPASSKEMSRMKRETILRRLRFRRKPKNDKTGKESSKLQSDDCPENITVGSVNYTRSSLKIDKKGGSYCGMEKAKRNKESCDCPSSCE